MIWLLALGCQAPPLEEPAAGALVLEQIRAPAPALGEAFLVVGPDGTSALVDVAADSHADEVREALAWHTGEHAVDWVILTHWHLDHIAGFDVLFDPAADAPVAIRRGVIVRGGPIGAGASDDTAADVEATLGALGVPVTRLCAAEDACADLPLAIPLGDGASLVLALANGFVAGDGVADARSDGVALDLDESEGENARSLGGWVAWGDFAYVFAGDLTGGGKGTPDVESFVAAHSEGWPDAEVLHLNHHGIQSSTNDAWVGRFLGRGVHHALVGANATFLDAPDEDVLDRLEPALGGGKVWAVGTGSLVGDHPALDDRQASVVVTVADDGAYTIQSREGAEHRAGGSWPSNP